MARSPALWHGLPTVPFGRTEGLRSVTGDLWSGNVARSEDLATAGETLLQLGSSPPCVSASRRFAVDYGVSMPFHSRTLPNGLQIIAEPSPSARSVALG